MDAVKAYGSDSDSDLECFEKKCGNTEVGSLSCKSVDLLHGNDIDKTSVESLESNVTFEEEDHKDFFGLESLQNTKTFLEEERKFQSETPTVGKYDIPDGKFWNDFDPEKSSQETIQCEVQTLCKADKASESHHQDVYRRKSKLLPSKRCRDFLFHDSVNRPSPSIKTLSQHGNHEKDCATDPSSQNVSAWSDSLPKKRKLYYIHSKVTPFLNSKQNNRCASKLVSTWPSCDTVTNSISWNIPSFSHLLLSTGSESSVKVWNVWSTLDKCVTSLPSHSKAIKHAQWEQDGRRIVSCSYDRSAAETDVETSRILTRFQHTSMVTALALHPSNPHYVITGSENLILMWDSRSPQSPVKDFRYKDKMGQIQDAVFIQNGSELITCCDVVSRDSADRTVMAWDLQSCIVLSNQIFQERYTCTRLKLHPSTCHFLSQTHGGYVAIFSTTRPYKMDRSKRCEGHKTQGYSIGFDISPDGSLVYSGSAVAGIHCYDYRSGRLIKKLCHDQNSVITDVTCHPVLSNVTAACTWSGRICLWQ